jgi:LysM repeat protein
LTVAAAGETLCDIASRLGVSVDALAAANRLEPSGRSAFQEGRRLTVRRGSRAVYRVQAGDSLGAIARWTALPIDRLVVDNAIADPDFIAVGQRLRLSAGARACPTPASFRTAERLLDDALERYATADFDATAERAERARALLGPSPGDAAVQRLRVRAAVLQGLAALGRGEEERAVLWFADGLALEPELRLDPALASPKVERLFERARRSGAPRD